MSKNRAWLLTLVCLALGVLVYLDRQNADDGIVAPVGPRPQRALAPAGDGIETGADIDASEAAAADVSADADTDPALSAHVRRLANPLADFDKEQLSAWTERPLFAPSRSRPPVIARADTPPPPRVVPQKPPPRYDLLGVLHNGERAIALLRNKGEGASFRVEVGDMIGGWRVDKMELASVVLKRGDGSELVLSLPR